MIITDACYRGDNSIDTAMGKVHSHLHLARDCAEYGSPMNYDAGLGERGLKTWAKGASKTAMKCGESKFIDQTSCRVSDQQILSNFSRLSNQHPSENIETTFPICLWKFSRKECHARYNLASCASEMVKSVKLLSHAEERRILDLLLHPLIVSKLKSLHGNSGIIEIWKGVTISLPQHGPDSKHHIRAFPEFDEHGSFYDWVMVKHDPSGEDSYWPSKALFLYRFEERDYCMCWCTQSRKIEDERFETYLSARWRMEYQNNGWPLLTSVDKMRDVVQTLYIYEHFHMTNTPIPDGPVNSAEQNTNCLKHVLCVFIKSPSYS